MKRIRLWLISTYRVLGSRPIHKCPRNQAVLALYKVHMIFNGYTAQWV